MKFTMGVTLQLGGAYTKGCGGPYCSFGGEGGVSCRLHKVEGERFFKIFCFGVFAQIAHFQTFRASLARFLITIP